LPERVSLLVVDQSKRIISGGTTGASLWTVNAAYQHFEEDIKGTIEVGKLADLVVLSENPLSMQIQDLLNLSVVATYSHGQEIYHTNAAEL